VNSSQTILSSLGHRPSSLTPTNNNKKKEKSKRETHATMMAALSAPILISEPRAPQLFDGCACDKFKFQTLFLFLKITFSK
jgi:hypothetical protein